MENKFYFRLTLQIMSIFIVAMLVSLIPDYLHTFFYDRYCTGIVKGLDKFVQCDEGFHTGREPQSAMWHWGYRHCIWFWMGIVIFIVQVIRVIDFVIKEQKKQDAINKQQQ